jgi:hypothetical protein
MLVLPVTNPDAGDLSGRDSVRDIARGCYVAVRRIDLDAIHAALG